MSLLRQSAYKILDTNPILKQREQLPRDLQELLETLEKTRFTSPNAMKCQHCGGNTIYHRSEECDGDYIIPNRVTSCISTHDDDDNWFICQECEAFHLQCPRCPNIQLCRFLGFEGVFTKGDTEEWRARVPPLDVLEKQYQNSYDVELLREYINVPNHPYAYTFTFLNTDNSVDFIRDYPKGESFPRYYMGDLNRFYAGQRDPNYQECLPGPDGGFGHQWKCPRCQAHYHITDK